MSSPFELSLDEYAELWKPLSQEEQRKTDISRTEEALKPAFGITLDLNDEQKVKHLLRVAMENRSFSDVVLPCLIRAAQICIKHQMRAEARQIYARGYIQASVMSGYLDLGNYRELLFQTQGEPQQEDTTEYFNPLPPPSEQLISVALNDLRMSSILPQVLAGSQPIIIPRIKTVNGGRPVTSRLGGVPDVEEGWQWPDRLEFLGQLNLEELTPYDVNKVLPERGLLRFFMLSFSEDWGVSGNNAVVEFYDGDLSKLQRARIPEFLTDVDEDDNVIEKMVYKEVELEMSSGTQLSVYEADFPNRDQHNAARDAVSYLHSLTGLGDERYKYRFQVLGAVTEMAVIPYPQRNEAKGLVLLFTIDSSDETKMMFNDSSAVCFYMRQEDLLARRFDRIETGIKSGG